MGDGKDGFADTMTLGTASAEPEVLAGRFELLGLLGSGGMGAVYRARDLQLGEDVALKMLRADLVSPNLLERFRHEVRLARKVTHKNVARVFDLGQHEQRVFLTMELVEGESLAQLAARTGAMALARVVALAQPICAGLAAAHAAGVVHRDLKPGNVLIARDGRVVLADFGVARVEADARATAAVGTPAYMAPEQVEGAGVDARADLYALGVMLYELLCGALPFSGATAFAVAAARLTRAAPDPRALRPELPEAAAQLVLRLLARPPADRPASADEVAQTLAGLPLAPTPTGTPTPPTSTPAPQAARAEHTLAVLPFRNAGAPDDEYLADGFTDELIDSLSMSGGVRVRSRSAVMRFKNVDQDPRQLGRELDVKVVAEGSVRRDGADLRITARLSSVADGFQLWAQRFVRPAGALLDVADEAARAIALAMSATRLPDAEVHDPIAADLYLRARFEYHKHTNDAGRVAMALFEQAAARAPRDGAILAARAMCAVRLANSDIDGQHPWLDDARAAAAHAAQVAPHRAECQLALAFVAKASGDYIPMVQALKAALRVAELAEAHEGLGGAWLEAGEVRLGLDHYRRALALDPQLAHVTAMMAVPHALMGEWDAADACLDAPTHQGMNDPHGISRARLALWRGDPARARALIDTLAPYAHLARSLAAVASSDDPAPENLAFLARGSARGTPRRRSFFLQLLTEIAASRGRLDAAIASMQAGADLVLVDVLWADRCPVLAPLRAHPGFAAVRAKIAARADALRAALRS